MPEMTISQVARQVEIKPSAIRYYERIGLLPAPRRSSGQRKYDQTVLYRLSVLQWARQLGFTLDEVRQLFSGFRSTARASDRWRKLSQRKLNELDDLRTRVETMQRLLKMMMKDCLCDTLDQCGRDIFLNSSTHQKTKDSSPPGRGLGLGKQRLETI